MKFKKVAYEPMNEIHQNELKILEKLLKKIENNEDFEKEFKEFLEDIKKHFAFEENLMKKYNFFAFEVHKMEHDKILNELNNLNLNDIKLLKEYFNNKFLPWLENHIATIDTVTGGFFNMIGAKNEF